MAIRENGKHDRMKTKKPGIEADIPARTFIQHLPQIEFASNWAIKSNRRIFQFFRFGQTDLLHVGRLLHWAEFPAKAKVIDMGCGTGEVARIMKGLRKDLSFCLVNLSEFQLKFCSE